MALTDFVDQLSAPGASSFSALASSSFQSLADFNASTTSEALKWADLEQNTVYSVQCQRVQLIHSMDNRSFCLSRKLMDWKSVQFVSTATLMIICKLFM